MQDVYDALGQRQHSGVEYLNTDDAGHKLFNHETYLINLIQSARVRLLSLNNNQGIYQMLLVSGYGEMDALLHFFLQHTEIFSIASFHLKKAEDSQIVLNIDMKLSGFNEDNMPGFAWMKQVLISPFCASSGVKVSVMSDSAVFPAKEVVALGWIFDGKRQSVLLRWPSGLLDVRNLNDEIGSDATSIVDINKNGIMLRTPGNEKIFLSYQE